MKNKTIANLMIASLVLAILNSIVFGEIEGIYSIAGLGMGVFGIWSAVRLYKFGN